MSTHDHKSTGDRRPTESPSAPPGRVGRDPRELEGRRMAAAALFEAGIRQAEVARQLGVSHQTVSRWHARWHSGGRPALAAGTTGRRPKLSPEQLAEIGAALRRPPAGRGLPGNAWTVRTARELITQVAGVAFHPSQIWRILRQFDTARAPLARRAPLSEEAPGHDRRSP